MGEVEEGAAFTRLKESDRKRYFLKGIVSKAPNKGDVCNEESHFIVTNTTLYLDFIKKHEIEYRPTPNINGMLDMHVTHG